MTEVFIRVQLLYVASVYYFGCLNGEGRSKILTFQPSWYSGLPLNDSRINGSDGLLTQLLGTEVQV